MKRPTAPRRSWPVVTLFGCIIALQLVVAIVSIELLSSVRAYVTGESLYSKGQKDAQIYLLDYAQYHKEDDYRRFQQALAVPLGDRIAREELQRPEPDLDGRAQRLSPGRQRSRRRRRPDPPVPVVPDAPVDGRRDRDVDRRRRRHPADARSRRAVARARPAWRGRCRGGSGDARPGAPPQQPPDAAREQVLGAARRGVAADAAAAARRQRRARRAAGGDRRRLRAPHGPRPGPHRRPGEGTPGVAAATARLGGGGPLRRRHRGQVHVHQSGRAADARVRPRKRAARSRDLRPRPALALGRRIGGGTMRQANTEHQEVHLADADLPPPRRDVFSGRVLVASGRPGRPRSTAPSRPSSTSAIGWRCRPPCARASDASSSSSTRSPTASSRSTATNRIVLFNRAAEALFGVAAADALGGPVDRFIPYRPSDSAASRRRIPAAQRSPARRRAARADRQARQRGGVPARGIALASSRPTAACSRPSCCATSPSSTWRAPSARRARRSRPRIAPRPSSCRG